MLSKFQPICEHLEDPLLVADIRAFIRQNENADVRALALKKPPVKNWPYTLVLDQIKARQKAALKCPELLNAHPDILLPSADLIEQASSPATARYKAHLLAGDSFADLTAGTGVDALAFAARFSRGLCIDRDLRTAQILAHNLCCLNRRHVDVYHADALEAVAELPPLDIVYLDPQRRTQGRKGLFRLEDTSPDITILLPLLAKKAKYVMLKASPMLDIDLALKALGNAVAGHILEYNGECRELVFVVQPGTEQTPDEVPVTAAILDQSGAAVKSITFTRSEEKHAVCAFGLPEKFLFDPGPAFHKSGAFKTLAVKFGLRKLHPQTHLYTGSMPCPAFPGRSFEITGIAQAERKALALEKANLAVRNFPMDVENLKKKLGLKDGGKDYVFACTLADGKKALIKALRID